ncbi:MAG: family 20 glycosylhydrolase [Clostridia bacterium]|nr:family 20 glycosylhydrolase [Clostridia bacterium]
MFKPETILDIRSRVAAVTGITLPYSIDVSRVQEGLHVTLQGGHAVIAAENENALARGYFLLSRCLREDRTEMDETQSRRFSACGAMADCSRGAVMTVRAVKRYIDQLASLGMNMLMLYTEDTYEVPEYPRLGYLRGRYTQEELRELDDYAASIGVELVPCIQTLGHMKQFLQWAENGTLRDQPDVLICGEEQTYAFIESCIRSMRSCMRSKRIHIGMDEAHGVGLGRYLARHGMADRFELLHAHVCRVTEICRAYDFKPMMWSDMYFRLGSKNNDYYDTESRIPQAIIDRIPEIELCYWDYYHTDEAFYDSMLARHEVMGSTVFAGGIWTWWGFLPQVDRTRRTMLPALRACARRRVDTVFATLWGDDGAETDIFLSSGLLPYFSENCWQGPECPETEIALAGELVSGIPQEVQDAFALLYPDDLGTPTGKNLIWCDPLFPLLHGMKDTYADAIDRAEHALAVLSRYDTLECRYAALVFQTVAGKAQVLQELRGLYCAGDREGLADIADKQLPALHKTYGELCRTHRALWIRDNKRPGWEVIALRYGAVSARLLDAAQEIREYLDGDIPVIEALEEEPMSPPRYTVYAALISPAAVTWTV